jgi:purine-binding chemotaxis protein CheW
MTQTQAAGPVNAARKGKSTQEVVLRQYLTFNLGSELFALPIEHIREIIECSNITAIPLMPEFLRGVINLRGAVVPVLDLSVRFSRISTEIGKRTCVILLEVDDPEAELQTLGVLVDSVSAVMDIDVDQIEPRPTFGANLRTDFIEGILKSDGRMVIILDVRQVVSLDELATLVGVAAGDVEVETIE